MGKIKYALIVLLTLITVSCDGLFGVDNVGKPIKFGTGRQTTRVYYPDIHGGLMQWENGDEVRIYMYWRDFNGNEYGPQIGDYYINYDTDNGYQSYGKLVANGESLKWQGDFSFGDGRAHEYPHTFVSAYPKQSFNGYYSFSLPSMQNGSTECLYMTAYEENVTSKENEWVYLRYYPAVTTLVVTIDNDADMNLGTNLRLVATGEYLISGAYNVYPSDRSVSIVNGSTIVDVPMTSDPSRYPIVFYIIPRYYPAGRLYFRLDDLAERVIQEDLEPFHKYNIRIRTTEVEVEEPTLPPVYPGGLSDGACQFLLGTMESLQEVFRALLGNDFINNRFNGLRNLGRNITAEDFYQYLTEEDIIGILTYFQTCSEIELKTGNHLNSPISAEDFLRIIPSCQTLTIRSEQETEWWFKDLKLLHTINVEGNGKVTIHADGCSSLTNVTWWDSQTKNGSGIYINGAWQPAQ